MSGTAWARMLATIAAGLLLAGGIVLSHPNWFDTGSIYRVPVTIPNSPVPATPSRVVPSPTPAMPRVGMPQHLDAIWITPLHATPSQGANGILPNLGDEFLVVELLIANRSQVDYPVNPDNFKVLDSHGELVSPLSNDFTREHLRRDVSLVPGGYTRGTLIFEVPAHDHALTLIYQPEVLDPTKNKIWLLP